MNTKTLMFVMFIGLTGCNDSAETQFLNNFKTTEKIDNNSYIKVKKEISEKDIYVLTSE